MIKNKIKFVLLLSLFFIQLSLSSFAMENEDKDFNSWKHITKQYGKGGFQDEYRRHKIVSERSTTWIPRLEFVSFCLRSSANIMVGFMGIDALKEQKLPSKLRLFFLIGAPVALTLDNAFLRPLIFSYETAPKELDSLIQRKVDNYVKETNFEEKGKKNKQLVRDLIISGVEEL